MTKGFTGIFIHVVKQENRQHSSSILQGWRAIGDWCIFGRSVLLSVRIRMSWYTVVREGVRRTNAPQKISAVPTLVALESEWGDLSSSGFHIPL